MKATLVVLVLVCATALPCFCIVAPTVTAQVSELDGFKHYVYTLTNSPDGGLIYGLALSMPSSAARSVTSFVCSKPSWWCYMSDGREERSGWNALSPGGWSAPSDAVHPGESITFTLITPAAVPTSDSYTPIHNPSNWMWFATEVGGQYGSYLLPVPVPEPSSLATLLIGLAISATAIRRRTGERRSRYFLRLVHIEAGGMVRIPPAWGNRGRLSCQVGTVP